MNRIRGFREIEQLIIMKGFCLHGKTKNFFRLIFSFNVFGSENEKAISSVDVRRRLSWTKNAVSFITDQSPYWGNLEMNCRLHQNSKKRP